MSRPGSWKEIEQFGRYEATGTLDAELELPEGAVLISSVALYATEKVEVELLGPDGPVALTRERSSGDPDHANLTRLVSGTVTTPGLHRLRVSGIPGPGQELIMVGREVRVGDMLRRSIPGLGMLRRRRGG